MALKQNYDFRSRLERARKKMAENGLDALYINAGPNMRYFAGWTTLNAGWPVWLSALIIPAQGEPVAIMSKMHHDILIYSGSWLKDGDVRTHMDGDNPTGELTEVLREKGLLGGCLGVENNMWYGDYELLTEADPTIRVKRATGVLDSLRRIKDREEIEALRRASAITEAGYQRSAEVIREGVPEAQAVREIVNAMLDAGSDTIDIMNSFKTLLPRKFEKGDVIDVDMGARWDGYGTDMARNVFVGQPSNEVERAYRTSIDCFQRTMEMVKPGIEAQEVHHFAVGYMKRHGFDQVWKIGHGVGLNRGHEAPLMQAGETLILEPGLVFVIDPGCFITGQFRDTPVHVEDAVVVTETGCENLNHYTHEMVVT